MACAVALVGDQAQDVSDSCSEDGEAVSEKQVLVAEGVAVHEADSFNFGSLVGATESQLITLQAEIGMVTQGEGHSLGRW